MRALIIDDEPLAREGVALRLQKFKDVDVVGECGNGPSAVEKIVELSPDLVFLDVQLPGMDGFEVLRALPKESVPQVIFLTAYEQHALRAFEVHALDYLLKPVDDERFDTAVRRARQVGDAESRVRLAERVLEMVQQNSANYVSRFPVRIGSRIHLVFTEDIEWVRGAGNYAEFHGGGRCHLLRETLNSLEQKLDPSSSFAFIAPGLYASDASANCSRSTIVSISSGCQMARNTVPAEPMQIDWRIGYRWRNDKPVRKPDG